MPEIVTPEIVLADHAQRRHRDVLALIELRIARGLRRQYRVDDVEVVVADVTIIGEQIVGVTARRLELVGLHRHAGDEGGDVVGRTAEHAIRHIGDAAVADRAPLQVVARARAQEIDRMASAILLVAHHLAIGWIGLHVVERRDGLRGVAEGAMAGHVVDALAADVNHAAVAQQLDMLFSSAQHAGKTVIYAAWLVKFDRGADG